MPVEPLAVPSDEDRSFDALADGQVDRSGGAWCERDGDDLASLAQHGKGAMAAFDAEGLDVRSEGFGDPQPVDGQQRHERVLAG